MNCGLVFLAAVATAVVATAVQPVAAHAADPGDVCGLTAISGDGAPMCLDADLEARHAGAAAPAALPDSTCRLPVEFLSWTASDWALLGQALVDNATSCGEYWVSIPPLAANKTGLRVLQDDVIRALGPNIHPVAEVTLGTNTGWAKWVANGNGTWFQAGVEFRRRMAAAGYDVTAGETWLLNEFDRSTMRDAPRTTPDQTAAGGQLLPPYRRADMIELLKGLYYGDVGMPPARGAVEYGIHFRHQNIPDVPGYKAELKSFLADGPFWEAIGPYIRWFAVETYPDLRYWGVPGSSRNDRVRHLDDYIFHVLDLARNGPTSVDAARTFLERTYLPLLNGGWRARGGDQFEFVTGHGNTIVDARTMQEFVSEQIYAARHYAGAHTQGAPSGRVGFSFEPVNRQTADQVSGDPWTPQFRAEVGQLVTRIATAVRDSYGQGGSSPVGACVVPGTAEDWCTGTVPGAAFTEAWADFGSWRN
jgi:hypothetical protein